MTVDISHIAAEPPVALPALESEIKTEAPTQEPAAALAVPAPIPEVPARPTAPATPPAAASQQATDRPNGPDSGGATSLPFAAYFAVSDVDVRAEPINEVLLHYPSAAYIQRISGVVQFRLFISAQGVLDKAELIDGHPRGIFENAAWDAVKKLQFSPARKNGRPVNSQKTIDVVFEPYEDLKPTVKRKDSSVAEK